MLDLSKLPYIQATQFKQGVRRSLSSITQIVLHTAEVPEAANSARNVANYFAGGSEGRPASAHFCVDNREIIHCVQLINIAYGAPGANSCGVHIEHSGYAAFGSADWSNLYSEQMLNRSAQLSAALCKMLAIPVLWLTPMQVRNGAKGICGHRDVTEAYPEKHGTHFDPGGNFPKLHYLDLVHGYLEKG